MTPSAPTPARGGLSDPVSVGKALRRYRAVSNVVGVVLIVFLLIAVPLRYLGGDPRLSHTISPIHGFFYVVYLGVTVDLARRVGWSTVRTVLVMLAGTVPFVSFVVERRTTRDLAAGVQAERTVAGQPAS